MTELPEELRKLLDKEGVPADAAPKSADDRVIEDVAHLLFPVTPRESPRITEDRSDFIRRYRRKVARNVLVGGDDALLDQLRALRNQKEEVARRIRVLLAYSRTTPPKGRKYRLRDLSEVTGLPISSIRDLITSEELQELSRLNLDDAQAEALAKKQAEVDNG